MTIVMVGTSLETRGGISAVVAVYRAQGLFERAGITYLASHRDGGAFAKLAALAEAWLRFAGLLVARRVALLHVHAASRASFWRKCLFLLPAFAWRVPTVFHLHGAEFALFFESECGPRRRAFVRWVLGRVDAVIVLSTWWEAWMRASIPAARVAVIHNPIVVPALPPAPRVSDAIVLSLGRLGHRKGSYDLLAAIAQLKSLGIDARLRLGGDGELDAVRARAVELGIADRVDLLGWVGARAKDAELAAARVYTLPSYNEGLPMSVLEAMAAGLPVVATPVGGIPDALRDGTDGYLVTPGDVDALAARLGALLTDPLRAGAMGFAAHERARAEFSADALVPRIEAVYRDLLGPA